MKRCPITYEVITEKENYSERGLRLLSPKLKDLKALDLSADEQRKEAIDRAGKISIQGVQTKLSAVLKIKEEAFEIVDKHARYILKPQSNAYPELPENEAITMTLAETIGLEVPVHGLVYSKDNSMTYFIKRFDRTGHNKKLALEDFAQLLGEDRYTKYRSSMEKVITVIERFCTFPKIELLKLFKLTLFNLLIGNEDMHLKNFSLITKNNKILLAPAYDLLNSTIAQNNAKEEMALPLRGRKNNLTQRDIFYYFATVKLKLNEKVIAGVQHEFQQAIPIWQALITHSFLSDTMQKKYLTVLEERCNKFKFIF
ncbi:MAG: HipA domain-containing protein [Gammaproteobacteria bacterium]|nr:HipA domain-containing protein [Gammaproteobacteria bacterium]